MKKPLLLISVILCLVTAISCSSEKKQQSCMDEIAQTEKDFEAMAAAKGVAEAFYFYADENAVISIGDTICKGRENIRKHYQTWKYHDAKLTWSPDYVTVSSSCDMGYTYGRYHFTAKDSSGKPCDLKGYFHTIWKKQPDGKWKFVWD